MYTINYIVAEHRFCIVAADASVIELLPSYEPFLCDGDGEPLFTLTVDNSIVPSWQGDRVGLFPCNAATFEVYRRGAQEYRILISDVNNLPCAFMHIKEGRRHITVTLRGSKEMMQFGLNNAIMLAYTVTTAAWGTVLMHSSVVENAGRGYMFLGASGRGKSTHSDLWVEHIAGSTLINDDNPVVRIAANGTPVVYGTPWSGKRSVYKNVCYPIGGLVSIVQKPQNSIRKETVLPAFGIMIASCSTFKFDKDIHLNICRTISGVLDKVSVYTLECRADAAAAQLSSSTLGV